jgi:5-methylcytosine-specific restriction endonuclease McrA
MTKAQQRQLIKEKFNCKCAYCGVELKDKWHIDHVIPKHHAENGYFEKSKPLFLSHLSKEDVNHIDNLFPVCQKCNNFKKTFNLELFRKELGEITRRLRQYENTYNHALRFGLVQETQKEVKFYFETL